MPTLHKCVHPDGALACVGTWQRCTHTTILRWHGNSATNWVVLYTSAPPVHTPHTHHTPHPHTIHITQTTPYTHCTMYTVQSLLKLQVIHSYCNPYRAGVKVWTFAVQKDKQREHMQWTHCHCSQVEEEPQWEVATCGWRHWMWAREARAMSLCSFLFLSLILLFEAGY